MTAEITERTKINEEVYLVRENGQLFLTDGTMRLAADFTSVLPRIRPSNLQRELLVRGAKKPGNLLNPVAVDATAGFGEDAAILAAAGYTVHLYENDPVIAALLRDALRRAGEIPDFAPLLDRMILHEEDSIAAMRELREAPDIIYLDPMFPERQKSGLVKKKFQLLHHLERPCPDEAALLGAALSAGPRRVLIKRPQKGPYLAGRKPDFSLGGKSIRIDVWQGKR